MRLKKTKQLLMLALMTMLLAAVCQAQAKRRLARSHATPVQGSTSLPTARVLQLNEDGSYVVEIGGQKFRALTRPQLDSWAKMEIDLKGALALNEISKADNAELEKQKATLNDQKAQLDIKFIASEDKVKSLTEDLARAREDTKRTFGLFMGERQLRTEATQFIPHSGNPKGIGGFFLKALDSTAAQVAFKLVIPVAQFTKVMIQDCSGNYR